MGFSWEFVLHGVSLGEKNMISLGIACGGEAFFLGIAKSKNKGENMNENFVGPLLLCYVSMYKFTF